MDSGLTAKETNMLQSAEGHPLITFDWTTPTTNSLLARGLLRKDGPWLHITADGRNALAQIEEAGDDSRVGAH